MTEDSPAGDAPEGSTQPLDHNYSPDNPPFSDHPETVDPFSDHHETVNPFSDNQPPDSIPLPHAIPFDHPLLPSALGDKDMDISPSSSDSEDNSGQHPPSIQPSLNDEDIGFEDSGLDPASTGLPSLSEQLKERLLKDYHGGGGSY